MPAPATTHELLELVQKSGVVNQERLEAYLADLRATGPLPAEPAPVADRFVFDGILTAFQAELILQGKWRRFFIGRYKILERLGSGRFGSVYLFEDQPTRQRVAVKILPTARTEDPSSLERFYREGRALAALRHPNIVRGYDIDQEDKLHFLVMEYVNGSSLQYIIDKAGPMDLTRAAHYIRQAALGLQHAHEAGVVHRDIKPADILMDRSGIVKIIDFGLCRFVNDATDSAIPEFPYILGTEDYIAPEQALNPSTADIRADIYSLGATFYCCLAGRPPFSDGSMAQKLTWHQIRQPEPIGCLQSQVPERTKLATLIERMMAKDPAQRPQTPQEVADALAEFTEQPIGPPPEDEMPRLSPAASGDRPSRT